MLGRSGVFDCECLLTYFARGCAWLLMCSVPRRCVVCFASVPVCLCVFTCVSVIRVVQELPDLVGMSSLTSLDVTMNNLAFLPTSLGFVTGLVVGW